MTYVSCTVAGCTCNLSAMSSCLCPPYGHYQDCQMINEDYSRGWEDGYNAHTRYWVCCYETHEYEQQCTRRVPYGHGYTCDLCPWGRDKVRTVNEYAQHLRREHCAVTVGLDVERLRKAVDAIPRLRVTGEQLDAIDPDPEKVFYTDWDEWDEYVRLEDVRAAIAAVYAEEVTK